MKLVVPTKIPDVFVMEPRLFEDSRGFFFESFNQRQFAQAIGRDDVSFVQDNHSRSTQGTLRGIHYQIQRPQGKLVRVAHGLVFDVAVDLRRASPTFGQYVGVLLSDENKRMLWIPEGCGHAFLVLSKRADFLYKTTDYYAPEAERCIIWNDAKLAIDWPMDLLNKHNTYVQLSNKDQAGQSFLNAEVFA